MSLLTAFQHRQLLENGSQANRSKDHFPVIKLFTPDAAATWLLTELDPDEPTIAFGLCDLGLGFTELGYVSMDELAIIRGPLGLPVECDEHFEAKYPISVYARAASAAGSITDKVNLLERAKDIGAGITPTPKRGGLKP